MDSTCFHLAFALHDFDAAKQFYIDGLGCQLGRKTDHAMIFNLGENQMVAHNVDAPNPYPEKIYPHHFGLIFSSLDDWQALADRAKQQSLNFYREPFVRHEGKVTEHHSFFLIDPSNNLLEFKYYAHPEAVFGATQETRVGEA
jgi:uncharacterized protein